MDPELSCLSFFRVLCLAWVMDMGSWYQNGKNIREGMVGFFVEYRSSVEMI